MDTEKCRALLCALSVGTLSGAAERMGYTPSGISRMLVSLEEETGLTLLYRNRSGVIATRECQALLPSMRQMLYYEECCRQMADGFCGLEQGMIIVGASYGFYFRHLARLMAQFQKRYPGISFRVVEGTSTELTAAVNEHRADVCIVSRREGAPSWIPLSRDELMVMLTPSHPLAERTAIPLTFLESEDYIDIYSGKETDNSLFMDKNHIQLKHRFTCVDDVFSAMAMVEAGFGITIINAVIAKTLHGDVIFRPLQPAQYVDIGIITHSEESMSPAAKRFTAFMKSALSSEPFR